jgi:hypothetical protein
MITAVIGKVKCYFKTPITRVVLICGWHILPHQREVRTGFCGWRTIRFLKTAGLDAASVSRLMELLPRFPVGTAWLHPSK